MKLITKINLNFLSAALFIFFIGSAGTYVLLQATVHHHIDAQLRSAAEIVVGQVDTLEKYAQPLNLHGSVVLVERSQLKSGNAYFADTLLSGEKLQMGHYRKMEFYVERKNFSYKVQVHKSLRMVDELTIKLIFGISAVVIFFLAVFFFLNRYVAISSLGDFFRMLQSIRDYKMTDSAPIALPDTDIDELEQLNKVLRQMMTQLRADYLSLKEFTENASHEIQTPLTIINARVEQLIQHEELSEEVYRHLSAIYEASNRLSKFHKGLLLLAKIENRQFGQAAPVDLQPLIEQQLEGLSDFTDEKQLAINVQIRSRFRPLIDPYLAELLVFNLIKNAIKHNLPKGRLDIVYVQRRLRISNTGISTGLSTDKLFERFVKGPGSKSLGLGLAIVQKICALHQIEIHYSFEEPLHHIELVFPSPDAAPEV